MENEAVEILTSDDQNFSKIARPSFLEGSQKVNFTYRAPIKLGVGAL